MPKKQTNKNDNSFSSSLGFLFAAVAASVGLSNIWRFSAEAANYGGGIYVIIYLLCIVLIGYPVILAELSFGRSNQKGLYYLYKDKGNWKWLGALSALTCFLIFCFYNIVSGWVLGYIWQYTKGIVANVENSIYLQESSRQCEVFFQRLRGSLSSNLVSTLLMALFAVIILQAGVSNGIEKCAKVLMPLFVVMILGLIGYSFTLSNCTKGLKVYLYPDISKFSLTGLSSALSQSLMSLSIGIGALVTYGTYVDKKDNLYKSSLIIGLGDTAVAIFAGLFLFAFMGHNDPDIANQEIKAGTGLAFVTLPKIFIGLRSGGSYLIPFIVGVVFFSLTFFAAITSSISMLEVPCRYIEDRFGLSRTRSLWLVAGASYAISIVCILSDAYEWGIGGYTIHDIYQDIVVRIIMPISALLFSLFIAIKWRVTSLFAECSKETKPKKGFFVQYINISVKYICPLMAALSFGIALLELLGYLPA